MDNKIKHLEMIQSVISRMSKNSFALKGWSVTLVSGIFALSAKDSDRMFFLTAYIPIVIFWGLDSYYLMLERKYRLLYEIVRNKKEEQINFDMNITISTIEGNEGSSYYNCVTSITEIIFYLPLALITAIVILIGLC